MTSTVTASGHERALRQLKKKLGEQVRLDHETRYRASFDNTRVSRMPSAVIQVESAEVVPTVLRLANQYLIPVTARGSGTGNTAAARPETDGWVLDMSRLRSCKIDLESAIAEVEPGVVVADLQDKVESKGWFYPPDPSSRKFCTIGGTLACNAGGMRCAKYGVTRDYVLALEGYLPTGDFVRWGLPLKKYVSGYNLRDLWIGSEGQLGVITKAWLKLLPRPVARRTGMAAFPTEEAALKAVRAILKARVVPSILEFMDVASITCCERFRGAAVFEQAPGRAILLWETDGSEIEAAEQAEKLRSIIQQYHPLERIASSAEEAEQLWNVRRQCSPAMFQMGDSKINEDIVIPLAAQLPLMRLVKKISREQGLAMPVFGHAADGNFHVHVMYNRANRAHCRAAEKTIQYLMESIVKMGGAITGEHGIGVAKSPFFALQHSAVERKTMLAIKQALDPRNILNPGKMFVPENIWRSKTEAVSLPWEHR
jgi:glycolate oxidase